MSESDDLGEDALELSGWSPRHYKVALLLAAGTPTKDIVAEASVRRETVWRYQQLPGFMDLVDRLTAIYFKGLVNKMWALGGHAMEVLHEALDERDSDAALDIFKTIAPGLRDVSPPAPPAGDSSSSASPDAGPNEQTPKRADAEPIDECPHCGRKTKSARGLTQHIKRKH